MEYILPTEPMTHPDFNTILRLCSKTFKFWHLAPNGFFINERKKPILKG